MTPFWGHFLGPNVERFFITACFDQFWLGYMGLVLGPTWWGFLLTSAWLTPFWGQNFGLQNRVFGYFFLLQATAYFRWINAALAAAEQEPLIINMDEASLAYHVGGGVGTVLRTQPLSSLRPADRSRLSDRRGNVTYLASICNDPSLNSKLPQILLGNTHRFSLRLLGQAKGFLPDNIILWRESSAWNNRQVMQRYIQVLCKSLEECMAERSVFLVVDMAPCHIHPDVRAMAMKTGIRMLLVPGGLTGALQPLDTHVFREFRRKLQALWLESRSSVPRGELCMSDWLKVVRGAILSVVAGKDWQCAFEQTGILFFQSHLTAQRLHLLGWEACPQVAPGLPGLGQGGAMFPRRSKANVAEWVQWYPVPAFVPIQTLD